MTGYDMADAIRSVITEQREEITALKAENDRLRELVKGLYEFAYAEYPSAAKACFADDLRKLGIEVDT